MSKRLLILSDYIQAPSFSPRLMSMIRHLTENGWHCTLANDNPAGQQYHTDLCLQVNMTYIPDNASPLRRLYKRLTDKLFNARERQFTQLLATTFQPTDFDLIFCSTYYYFPLQTAAELSRRWHIPFVVDVRDIAEQWGKTPYFKSPLPHLLGLEKLLARAYERHNIRRRNRVLRQAAAVTTVSPWHRLFLQNCTTAPVSLIYNGFDEQEITPLDKPSKLFRISFIGRLINLQLRRPEMLFDAVGQLIRQDLIPADRLRLDFYCEPEHAEALRQMAARHHITGNLCLHSYIARSDIQNAIAESSILLALGTPASEQQHGILGTKIFEAIGAEKPFMLIPSDKDDLAQLIADTGIGIAALTVDDIQSFIHDKFREWQTNGFTRQPVRNKALFTRRHQSRQFEQLLNEKIMNYELSIIIPAYNAADYLAECLCSVKNQTVPNWRCIIVDDASTDDTARIAQAFVDADDRFILLSHTTNRGQSAARNTALDYLKENMQKCENEKTHYLTFLDADDYLDSDFLATHLQALRTSDIQVLQSGYRRITGDGRILETKLPCNRYQFSSPCMRLYRADILRDLHFREGMIYEDVLFSLELWTKRPTYALIPYIGYNYRLNPSSTTARKDYPAQRRLYNAIGALQAPYWLKIYTLFRLKAHFRK